MGGPLMNLLIGVVLLTFVVTVHGVATAQPGAVVASVSQCVVPVTEAGDATTCTDQPKTPALLAGVRPGDHIVSIAGQPVVDTKDVGELIRPRVDEPVQIVLERDGKQLTVTATPIRNVVPVLDADGVPVTDPDGSTRTTEAGFLGVRSAPPVAYVAQPVTAVPGMLWSYVSGTAQALVHVPERMVGVWQAAFSGAEREVDSPMSVVGVGRVAGEASTGKYDSLVGDSAGDKVWFLIGLLAALNFMLFLFNLIPLLPLDGGHVAGALWEGLKRQIAKLRGRPDPGYVDVAKALPIAYTVSMVLLGASLLLIYADVVKPVNLGG
jgi:membrane-associated protease RseP (regulator of RpoE activity)